MRFIGILQVEANDDNNRDIQAGELIPMRGHIRIWPEKAEPLQRKKALYMARKQREDG
jgi:hypothetical protein